MIRASTLATLASACVGLIAASPARAQISEVDASRVVLVGGGPLTGHVETEAENNLGSITSGYDTDAAGLVGVQYETPLVPYLSLVARFQAVRFHYTSANRQHRTFFDFGVAPTATFAVDAGKLRIEPRLGVPVGFTLHLANQEEETGLDLIGVSRANAGWHVGMLTGAHLGASHGSGFAGRLGGFFELGFLHHSAYASGDNDTKYRLRVNQFVIQVGLSVTL